MSAKESRKKKNRCVAAVSVRHSATQKSEEVLFKHFLSYQFGGLSIAERFFAHPKKVTSRKHWSAKLIYFTVNPIKDHDRAWRRVNVCRLGNDRCAHVRWSRLTSLHDNTWRVYSISGSAHSILSSFETNTCRRCRHSFQYTIFTLVPNWFSIQRAEYMMCRDILNNATIYFVCWTKKQAKLLTQSRAR